MPQRRILILANGEWESLSRLQAAAGGSGFTIAADGAWAKARTHGIPVDLVVGDLDSLTPQEHTALRASGTPVEAYPADKDWTDLELAIAKAISEEPEEISIYGAFGGRTDHALASVFLMEMGLAAGVSIRLLRGGETLYLVDGAFDLPAATPGDRVSLLPVSETARVTTRGLRFGLENETLLRAASRGVSNEVSEPCPGVVIHEGKVLLLHTAIDSEVAE